MPWKTKFTEQQVACALKQADTGSRVDEVCRKMGVSEATFYNWKKKYGGFGVSELQRLRQLEDENNRLKQIVADITLHKQMLEDTLKKSLIVRQLKQLAERLMDQYCVALRRACRTVELHWVGPGYYKPHQREDLPVRQRIEEIAATRVRYGMWRIYILLRREGFKDNHKRVYRVYKEEGLNPEEAKGHVATRQQLISLSVLKTTVYTSAGAWILCNTICLMDESSVAQSYSG